MNKTLTISIIFSLVIGLGAGYVIGNSKKTQNNMSDHKMMNHGMAGMMSDMSASLKGKSGDAFDKTFLEEMIVHHEGAVDMANMALQNAKHEEIKNLSKEIISAQEKEILMMKEWLGTWYK